jgi:hypothetical protein
MERTCPVKHCGKAIPTDRFVCGRHWYMLSAPERKSIWSIYWRYLDGKATLDELRNDQSLMCKVIESRMPNVR